MIIETFTDLVKLASDHVVYFNRDSGLEWPSIMLRHIDSERLIGYYMEDIGSPYNNLFLYHNRTDDEVMIKFGLVPSTILTKLLLSPNEDVMFRDFLKYLENNI